jgi:hypothetical protein
VELETGKAVTGPSVHELCTHIPLVKETQQEEYLALGVDYGGVGEELCAALENGPHIGLAGIQPDLHRMHALLDLV